MGNAVILTLDDKRNILVMAQEGGYLDGDIPMDADEINEQSQYFIVEAEKAWETGMRDPTVGKILVAVGILTQEEFEEAMSHGEIINAQPEEPEEEEEKATVNYASSGDGPPRSSGGYSESDLREPNSAPEAETEAEGWMRTNKLPIPESPTEQADLPADLTTLDDRVLRKYHSLNNGYLGKARWLLGIATGDLIRSEHLRDEAFRKSLLKVNRIDPKTDKAKSVATLDAEAKEDIDYQDWAAAANKHEREVAIRKSVVDIYQGNVAVLSREWTMRTEEFERTRIGNS
jgi:hypothetical protein